MTTSSPAVECHSLTVTYGATVAVDAISFAAQHGEVLGLLGPNGAGKTSAIRALTTILRPSGGAAAVAGFDLDRETEIRTRIGSLPESSGHPGSQTALSYLRYHGRLYGLSKQEAGERAAVLLGDLGLGAHHDSRIRSFSRGMKQRLGIARALINRPEVLFLDEPTLGLDPAGKDDILEKVRRLASDDGTAVILSSHLLDEVERVCDRVLIMNAGRLIASGSVAEVVEQSGVSTAVKATIPLADVERAAGLLSGTPGVEAVRINGRPGEVVAEVDGTPNVVASALVAADIPLLGLELEGASLQDAFLALTTRLGAPT